MQLARISYSMKDAGKAREFAEQVVAVYPDNVEAKNFLTSLDRETKPEWQKTLEDCKRFMPNLLKGASMTLLLVFFTMIVSPIGGLLSPLARSLFFIYYGLPAIGITLSPLAAALIGLGINYSAYLAEIIRAGIESIDDGQTEAA
ncbi:ABC transporter membrane protein permease protein ArtM/GltK/GlnP/TcyL/YhdX-like protein, partial [Aduncisulcus paluster]